MPNKFLSYDEQRAPKVHALFTRLADRYDLINDVQSFGLHRIWKRRAVKLALRELPPNARVLDLCCGTGDMVFEAQRGGAGMVVGVDFTEAMLDVALLRSRRREEADGVGDASADRPPPHGGGYEKHIFFARGDALRLPFAEKCFDAVTVAYGFRNVADLEGCLREMLRVVKPGGRIVILDFGKPDNAWVRTVYFGWLRTMQPLMGWLFHRDTQTYRYIIDSLMNFPAQRGIEEMMRRAGMKAIQVYNPLFGTMGINYGERAS